MNKPVSFLARVFLLALVVFTSTFSVQAQGSDCGQGECTDSSGVDSGGAEGGVQAEGMGGSFIYSLRGGYVAAGVGLRNRGFGTIKLTGIPAGAKVHQAFLYWNIVDNLQKNRHRQAKFAGHAILGTFIGADLQPCWLSDTFSAYSYRADVTAYVKGNGNYAVRGVASGLTSGADPFSSATKAPLADGASLVVIFTKGAYPVTQILLWDGASTIQASTGDRHIVMGPFAAATDPVGPAKATFIVADGQNSPGPTPQVNGTALSGNDLNGGDPVAGANFSQGNLWDTKTINIGNYISAGNTSVTVGLNADIDCAVWTAQVFSISKGTIDTDGDALLDGWEANGYDFDGNGSVDVDLPAMGASPFHKDIFVEHDYMPEHIPSMNVLNQIASAFSGAPVTNPDGKKGIKLHNDRGQGGAYTGGNSVAETTNMGATCSFTDIWNGFDAYKTSNFADERLAIFHYAIWAHNQCPNNGSSGLARGIPSSDFLVTLGLWPGFGSEAERAGTYMHELGHNLGLTHGGAAGDHVNYKPNHLSVMSYAFQIVGVWRSGARRWDYTRTAINALNENSLNESAGLTGATSLASYGTTYFCPNHTERNDNTAVSIDWNCNDAVAGTVSVDINFDTLKNTLGAVQNQWTHVIYNGGSIGAGLHPVEIQTLNEEEFMLVSPELSYEKFLEMQRRR
jgi:hypothetical protein